MGDQFWISGKLGGEIQILKRYLTAQWGYAKWPNLEHSFSLFSPPIPPSVHDHVRTLVKELLWPSFPLPRASQPFSLFHRDSLSHFLSHNVSFSLSSCKLMVALRSPCSSHPTPTRTGPSCQLCEAQLRCCSVAGSGRLMGACRRLFFHHGRTAANDHFS